MATFAGQRHPAAMAVADETRDAEAGTRTQHRAGAFGFDRAGADGMESCRLHMGDTERQGLEVIHGFKTLPAEMCRSLGA